MPDMNGRPYARLGECEPGNVLIADGGFVSDKGDKEIHCIRSGRECKVFRDDKSELYVRCAHGRHYLEGQLRLDQGSDELIGFYPSGAR